MKNNISEPPKNHDPIDPTLQEKQSHRKEPFEKSLNWIAEKTGQVHHAGETPEDHKWSKEKSELARHEAEERMEDLEEIREFAEENAEKVVGGLNEAQPPHKDKSSKDKVVAARHEAEDRIDEITHHSKDHPV